MITYAAPIGTAQLGENRIASHKRQGTRTRLDYYDRHSHEAGRLQLCLARHALAPPDPRSDEAYVAKNIRMWFVGFGEWTGTLPVQMALSASVHEKNELVIRSCSILNAGSVLVEDSVWTEAIPVPGTSKWHVSERGCEIFRTTVTDRCLRGTAGRAQL